MFLAAGPFAHALNRVAQFIPLGFHRPFVDHVEVFGCNGIGVFDEWCSLAKVSARKITEVRSMATATIFFNIRFSLIS